MTWGAIFILSSTVFIKCDISCNFSNNGKSCETWDIHAKDNSTDNIVWTVWQGPTQTYGTGPSGDHTNGSDYYIYLETSHRKFGETGQFSTPYLISSGEYVNVTFWYHMHGSFIGSLKVLILSVNNVTFPVWSGKQDGGDKWQFVSRMIEVDQPFKIIFRGMVGSWTSDIAVDDIYIQGADYASKSLTDTTERITSNVPDRINYTTLITYYQIPITAEPSFIIAASSGGVFWIVILFLLFCYVRKNEKENWKQKRNKDQGSKINNIDNTLIEEQDSSCPDLHNHCIIDTSPVQFNNIETLHL